MSRKAKDMWNRVWRTFLQGALGIFAATYIGPLMRLLQDVVNVGNGGAMPQIDLTFWRNALLAIVAGGVISLVSLVHNVINDYLNKGGTSFVLGKPVDTAVGDKVMGET